MTEDAYIDLRDYAVPPAELTGQESPESFEDYVSKAIVLRELKDGSQWTLGDLLCKMEKDLERGKGDSSRDANGETPLDLLAHEINEKPSTLRQYRWVSQVFGESTDRQTHLSWSHYRCAAGTGDAAKEWVQAAVDNNWTVGQLKDEIQKKQDTDTLAFGRPCAHCGGPLPNEGTFFIRRGKQKLSLCGVICVFNAFAEEWKTAQAEKKAKEAAAA